MSDYGKGKVIAVCISEKKGVQKKEISSVLLKPEWGIEGDAHAGKWHRQVSMLSLEKIASFRESTGTNKSIQLVMVTTYGIKENKYSGIVGNQVLLDDLFKE